MRPFLLRTFIAAFVVGCFVGGLSVVAVNAAMKGSAIFRDVPAGHFADEAIGELVSLGVIKGLDANRFGPDEPVTRAQVAILLKRFRDSLGAVTPAPASSQSSKSSSASSVSQSAASSSSSSSSSSTSTGPLPYNPGGYVHFGAREYAIDKNDAVGLVNVVIARIGGNQGAGTVDYAINSGTAVADKDYKPMSGTLTFGSKETSKKIQVRIINNTSDVAHRTVTMKLEKPTGALKIDSPDTATIVINDPRVPKTEGSTTATPAAPVVQAAPTNLSWSASEYGVSEDGGSLAVTVVRAGVTTGTTEVSYATTNGTAKAGTDYAASSGKLTFAPGETTKTVSIPVVDNGTVDGSKSLTLSLSAPSAGTDFGIAAATVLINDNEAVVFGSGSVKYTSPTYAVVRSAGKAVISVRHAAGLVPFSVNYFTSNGSAVAGTDYTSVSGTLNFAEGEVVKTFEVPVVSNRPLSSELTVNLTLQSPTRGVVITDPATATLKIAN